MKILWSLTGGGCHPTVFAIVPKLYRARANSQPEEWASVSAILLHSIRAQERKAIIAPVTTKMKPGAHILRTIA
jgi:hypothetical protein